MPEMANVSDDRQKRSGSRDVIPRIYVKLVQNVCILLHFACCAHRSKHSPGTKPKTMPSETNTLHRSLKDRHVTRQSANSVKAIPAARLHHPLVTTNENLSLSPEVSPEPESSDSNISSPPDMSGGTGKVSPQGDMMKSATNFSGELFQVMESKIQTPQVAGVSNNTAGVLYKWVNYGKGWRPRWFTFQAGVLSYYKVHGPDKVTLNQESHKGFRLIGEEGQRLMRKHKHFYSDHKNNPGRACGDIHLKVSTLRNSHSDDKKFYIYSGTKTLHLRAETNADRTAWFEALQAAKDCFPRSSLLIGITPSAEEITISTEKLRSKLIEQGLSQDVVIECEKIMLAEFSNVKEQLQVMQDRRTHLLERLQLLEADKVELETNVVDEMQSQGGVDGIHQLKRYYDGSDTETDDDHDNGRSGDGESDDDEEEFFDTKDSLKSSGSIQKQTSLSEVNMELVGLNYPEVHRRKSLPQPKEKEKSVSLWSMIKDNIGKDLGKVCLPVYFNEPISSLQRCFEDVEYSYLLHRAYEYGKRGDSLMRILCIGAFAVSGYSSTEGRTCKPFNPLLGETYEADFPDMGVRFVSEKVSHHPMILACHCEGRGWKCWGDSNLKSKFWGRSIQLDPVGTITLQFDDGEVFQWSKVTTSINNLILGKLYVDHYGTMRIQGNRELSCRLKFKEQSIVDRTPHQVQGFVHNKSGEKLATLFGKWDEAMYYVMGDVGARHKSYDPMSEAVQLWRRADPPDNITRYNLAAFAISLNELTPGLKEKLPPTDSRLRPDQRHLENGEYDDANAEKLRLERKQRRARMEQEAGWQPRWFHKGNRSNTYEYIGGYWEAREDGKWDNCQDIFGPDQTEAENCKAE